MEGKCLPVASALLVLFAVVLRSEALNGWQIQAELPQLVDGLSWDFYSKTCPNLESIVDSRLNSYLKKDKTQAAGLLRLHFHDCFVQGCDASVLLNGSASGPGEQSAIPNLTLRPQAFQIISDIKQHVEAACPNIVSCADIVALAARDSVAKTRGPYYPVPLGRRDSQAFATKDVTLASLPPFSADVTGLLKIFNAKGLDVIDLVALSGGHTIGIAHCGSFASRLSSQDPNLDNGFASNLRAKCPTANSQNFTDLDVKTPNRFDNMYYNDLRRKKGLLFADSVLDVDSRTTQTVQAYSKNQSLFFTQFSLSMIKMGQLGILTTNKGEIRARCSAPNPQLSAI